MAGDRARLSYSPGRKYREMLGLQGRVLLEADHNEGQRLFTEEVRHHALDFVGPAGTPDDGYKVTAPPADFQIGPGTMYVSGIRNTLEQATTYSTQPDWLDKAQPQPWADDLWRPVNQLSQGKSNVMLLLQEQEITACEDPALREVALGGPDSAARTRILQRFVARATDGSTCAAAAGELAGFWSSHGLIYDAATGALHHRARLQVSMVQNAPPPSPCDPPAASGYLGADNQLIRIQLVAFDQATLKGKLLWAYNNGSTLYRVKALDSTTLELASRPVSPEFEPKSGQVVQVAFSAGEMAPPSAAFPEGAYVAALTGHRAKLNAPYTAETRRVTLPGVLPAVFPQMSSAPPLFLRLWEEELDFDLTNPVTLTGTGLQVAISAVDAGMLHLGDSWSIAVRPLTPNAVYPERYLTAAQPPDSPRMWTCSLAVLNPTGVVAGGAAGGGFQVDDCRVPFDPLTAPHQKGQDCCCVKVTPKDAGKLQKIIDSAVKSANGAAVSIHLEPGLYQLRTPLRLDERHRGIVIEACAGKPVLTGGEDPRFSYGMILALKTQDVLIRGLEFRLVAAKIPDDLRQIMAAVGKQDVPNFGAPPIAISIGIRAVECLSLTVKNCDFRLPSNDSVVAMGVLIQGDNGGIHVEACRFDGSVSESIGVCLAPILRNADGALRTSSVEVLRIEGCLFARIRIGIFLASNPLLTVIEGNVTRYVNTSLLVLAFANKVVRVRDVYALLDFKPDSQALQEFVNEFQKDPVSVRMIAYVLLLPLGELVEAAVKQEFLYSLLDLTVEAAKQALMGPPEDLRLTLSGNQFDSRQATGRSGCDTLVWDLTSDSTNVTVTGNTTWNNSQLPTVAVLNCDGYNVTGNVIGNEVVRGNDNRFMALLVVPAMLGRVQMFTVTGNTISGRTNLADFPRLEWTAQLPKEFAPLLTWEFFNSIG